MTGLLATGALEATGLAGAAELPPPEPPPAAAAQLPEGGAVLLEVLSTSGPGLGNATSEPSAVLQPLPMLASKILGRLLNEEVALLEAPLLPPVTVTTAQFM